MRAFAAAVLALALVVMAGVPHGHLSGHGGGECALCVARQGDVARSESPDAAPAVVRAEPVSAAPGLAPVTGAPLGAIPGQSPPAGA